MIFISFSFVRLTWLQLSERKGLRVQCVNFFEIMKIPDAHAVLSELFSVVESVI